MKGLGMSRTERLRSAAMVKVKYIMSAGKLDSGFKFIFKGVLEDLKLTEQEVDEYIAAHEQDLEQFLVPSS